MFLGLDFTVILTHFVRRLLLCCCDSVASSASAPSSASLRIGAGSSSFATASQQMSGLRCEYRLVIVGLA